MTEIAIVDRSDYQESMLERLELQPRETAIVTIDMHRGHLDPAIATMPADPEDSKRVIANAKVALDSARGFGVPVIHVILVWRKIEGFGSEARANPFWVAMQEIKDPKNRLSPGRESTADGHNVMGEPTTEIIPELFVQGDHVIDNKKRLDCFMGTDLEGLLRTLGIKNLCLMGINTNTCVMNTAFSSFNRDFRTVVLSDCVASMYGEDLHAFGLQNVFRCIGWVVDNDGFVEKLEQGRKINQ